MSCLKWFLYTLSVLNVHATVVVDCKNPLDAVKVNSAVTEVVAVAAYAITKLANINDPVVNAAWLPLFSVTDIPTVLSKFVCLFLP